MTGQLRRERIPGWEEHAAQIGLNLLGRGSQRRARCPIHGGDRDSLAIDIDAGPWICHACGAQGGDVLSFHQQLHGLTFRDAAQDLGAWGEGAGPVVPRPAPQPAAAAPMSNPDEENRAARLRERAARLWGKRQCIVTEPDSPAAQYLQDTRRVPLPPADSDLAWHPDVREFGQSGPALIGRMSLAADPGTATGLHITWLQQDGDGLWQRAERRYLGPKRGCVIRLWPDEAVTTGLAIGEGIESCLTAALAFQPVWAAMDAGNLAAFDVLDGIEALTLIADHDPAGIEAAEACAGRWARAGREANIVLPDAPGTDLNDLARSAE